MNFKIKTSMSYQDEFAYRLFGNNGTYIEIGGNDPIRHSNTYNLEVHSGWKGFSVELDTQYQDAWKNCEERKNKIYWDNALTFDYVSAIHETNLPKNINYLSIDIEPASNTFDTLKRIIGQGITFDIITFEHDLYREEEDFNKKAIEFLDMHDYKVAVENVYFKKKAKSVEKIYETWFISSKFKKWKTIDYKAWLSNYNLIL